MNTKLSEKEMEIAKQIADLLKQFPRPDQLRIIETLNTYFDLKINLEQE